MLLDFNMMPEATIPGMNGGTGTYDGSHAHGRPCPSSHTRQSFTEKVV